MPAQNKPQQELFDIEDETVGSPYGQEPYIEDKGEHEVPKLPLNPTTVDNKVIASTKPIATELRGQEGTTLDVGSNLTHMDPLEALRSRAIDTSKTDSGRLVLETLRSQL